MTTSSMTHNDNVFKVMCDDKLYLVTDHNFEECGEVADTNGYLVVIGATLSLHELAEFTAKAKAHEVKAVFMRPFEFCGNVVAIACCNKYSEELNSELKELKNGTDAVHVKNIPSLNHPGVMLLDMDSTCIQIECIDEIARAYGVGEQIAEITSQAMHGLLDFKQSLRKRVSLLKDAPVSILEDLRSRLPIMPGFPELVRLLQDHGWYVAIASGGFMQFVSKLKEDYNLTLVRANSFEIDGDHLTGGLVGGIVDSAVKVATLQELCAQYGIPAEQSVAIGDGANDLPMITASGLGFAIHAKPIVRQKAPATINSFGLDAAACILEASSRLERAGLTK